VPIQHWNGPELSSIEHVRKGTMEMEEWPSGLRRRS
jgi:hypothetical protein